jgi:outer membrane protein TolC
MMEDETTMQKETDAPTLFNVNAKERQATRTQRLKEEEQKQNQAFAKALQESELQRKEFLKGRSKILPRSSLSSSSSSSIPLSLNVRNIGFSYGIGPDEIPAEGEDKVIKYHDWNTFQEKLDATEEQKAELRQQIKEARASGLAVPKKYIFVLS